MSKDIVIGGLVTFAALGFMTYLVLWSRRIIERIYQKRLGSAREILDDIHEPS